MKNKVLMIVMTVMFILPTFAQKTYPGRAPMTHEMTEYWLPQPSIVTPGQALEMFISAPSDAIVLFDGKDLTKWENSKGEPAEWTVHDGVFTVKKGREIFGQNKNLMTFNYIWNGVFQWE